ncbi:MAG: DUF4282 domain-containing protein [Anaerolineae bacterium]
MAEVPRTCANCGNVQAAGEFCEKCGTKLPPIPVAAAGAAAAGGQGMAPPPPPGYGAPPGAGPQYVPGSPGPGVPPYGAPRPYETQKGFFGRLFDFSFREFITPSIIKVLFIISIVVICLGVIGGIVFGFMVSAGTGVFALIGGIIYGFLMLLYVRVLLEIFIIFFRIYDNTNEIAKSKR